MNRLIALTLSTLCLSCSTSAGMLPTDLGTDQTKPDADAVDVGAEVITPPLSYHPLFDYVGTVDLLENTLEDGTFTHSQPAIVLYDSRAGFPYVLVEETGDCQYYRAVAECTPPCVNSTCQADGSCYPFPIRISAGTITFSGLAVELVASPTPSKYYLTAPAGYTEDLFAADAEIQVSCSGDDISAFDAALSGVADLAVPWQSPYSLTNGEDNLVEWTPSGSGTVELAFNAGWHGTGPAEIVWCTAPDAQGKIVVPQSMVESYITVAAVSETDPPSFIRRVNRVLQATQFGPLAISATSRVPFFLLHL